MAALYATATQDLTAALVPKPLAGDHAVGHVRSPHAPHVPSSRLLCLSVLVVFATIGMGTAALSAPGSHAVFPVTPACSSDGSCAAAINAAFAQCAPFPSCTVSLAAGSYLLTGPLYSTSFNLNNLRNVALIGAGSSATLLLHADLAGTFNIVNSVNVSFAGFAVDNARVPFTLVYVTSSSGGITNVTFDPQVCAPACCVSQC